MAFHSLVSKSIELTPTMVFCIIRRIAASGTGLFKPAFKQTFHLGCVQASALLNEIRTMIMSAPAARPQDTNSVCDFGYDVCTAGNKVWWCVDCNSRICDGCWPRVPGHRNGSTARDNQPHEKTDPHRHERLRKILNPPTTEEELDRLHEADVETTWFGIGIHRNVEPFLTDGGIYNTLIAQCPSQNSTKHPQLVSFIGHTNAGKSTLIKMLIDCAETHSSSETQSYFPTPVVGSSIHGSRPTSGDVHLYADPKKYSSPRPLFYADAEGLDAGAEPPLAIRRTIRRRGIRGGGKRRLEWADTPERRERVYMVGELYPRLLYTFSDVVVFVLKNEKTFETTGLERLIRWGAASLETSINQPTLPQLIIAVNAATLNVATPQEWEVDYATQKILNSLQSSLNKTTYFRSLAQGWRDRGRRIECVKDLIRCYYSSFSVVRIPSEGRYVQLDKQIDALRDRITTCCDDSFMSKRRANMLLTSDEFSMLLYSAFEHFSLNLHTPFNFIEVSLRINPIPQNFGGNILQLAIALHKQVSEDDDDHWIFNTLSNFIASSVLLDCVRHRKGLPYDHIGDYAKFFEYAFEQYRNIYSRCTFENDRGRCVNTRAAHESKGHQNSKGRIIAAGLYESNFTFHGSYNKWADSLDREIRRCQKRLENVRDQADRNVQDEVHALRLHKSVIGNFYRIIGTAKGFRSHTVCFSCLMEIPLHPLPCGHILCTPCVKGLGKAINSSDFSLDHCPLDLSGDCWNYSHIIRFKPKLAGVRVLSLDGGGIRGIVELEVLHAIQEEISDQIPIQAFFDLIVGTSTGGIIAIALGRNWPISRCISEFQKLCSQAFTRRVFHDFPILGRLETFNYGSKYKTKQLHQALETAFGKRLLFGGRGTEDTSYMPKVAVTATVEDGKKAVVIANYNRNKAKSGEGNKSESQYEFRRPDDPASELLSWEAAAATAAAPPYFKSFYHKIAKRSYLDGAFYNNNPVKVAQQERKMLWAEDADRNPDIFLSIGTSKYDKQLKREIRSPKNNRYHEKSPRVPFGRWHQLFNVIHGRMESILDAEMTWEEFVGITADVKTKENEYRYIRINPNIGYEPPDIDDVEALQSLQDATTESLSQEMPVIRNLARLLVASSFYLDLKSPPGLGEAGLKCTGRILCRLENNLRALGDYFMRQQRGDFQPYFEIFEDNYHAPKQQLYITSEIINRMVQKAVFQMDNFDIILSSRTARLHIVIFLVPPGSRVGSEEPLSCPISGFPRILAPEPSSAWSPPIINSGLPTQGALDVRRRARRVRKSAGSVYPQSILDPRPESSRTFSLPERSRTASGNEPIATSVTNPSYAIPHAARDYDPNPPSRRTEMRSAPPGLGLQTPPANPYDGDIRSEVNSVPLNYEDVPTQPISTERESSARGEADREPREPLSKDETVSKTTTTHSSAAKDKRSAKQDSTGTSKLSPDSTPPISELREHRRRRRRQPQPPSLPPVSPERPVVSSSKGKVPEISDIMERRRRRQMAPVPESRVAPDRADELSASTQKETSSRRVVRDRGPLSILERRLDPRQRSVRFDGNASDADVSQLGVAESEVSYY
ncbi:hypothetical protein BDZ45DRAFT_811773 [Acephala macrosclerotiorum]|nr:hypothetical protein BDZ45DRAFT_811773 [Acephala macrosclerotiorum]